MKVLVTYRTRSGNTKKIAEAIYDEITTDKEIKTYDEVECLDEYNFVFAGFPMERMGPVAIDEEFFQTHAKGKQIGLFITHASPENAPFLPPWLEKCRKAAEEPGAEIIGLFNCQGELSKAVADSMAKSDREDLRNFAQFRDMTLNQPDDSRIEKAREFAREMMKLIEK